MNNPTPDTPDQVDAVEKLLATYHPDSCPAETEFQEFFAPNLVQYCNCRVKKLAAKLNALLVDAEIRTLKSVYIDQGEIYVRFKGGFAEQYTRIAELEKQREA